MISNLKNGSNNYTFDTKYDCLLETLKENTNLSENDLKLVENKLYEFHARLEEKDKIIEQLQRGLESVSHFDVNQVSLDHSQRSDSYTSEIEYLKKLISDQENIILTQNKNLFDLNNDKNSLINAKQEAFKLQHDELLSKEKLIQDQQKLIESLKVKIENFEETNYLSKSELEKQLNEKTHDLSTKIEQFERSLHEGRKYFEEIFEEKDELLKVKSQEIEQLKGDLLKLSHSQNADEFNKNLNEKTREIDELRFKISQYELHGVYNLLNMSSSNEYEIKQLVQQKLNDLQIDLELKQNQLFKLKSDLNEKTLIITERDKQIVKLENQLNQQKVKMSDSLSAQTIVKNLSDKYEQDLASFKQIADHQVNVYKTKIEILEKTILNYQNSNQHLSRSSDALVKQDESSNVYKHIIDDLQKLNAQLETDKIDFEVKCKQLEEKLKLMTNEREKLNKKYTQSDENCKKLIAERDAFNLQHLSLVTQQNKQIELLKEQLNELNQAYLYMENEKNNLLMVKNDFEVLTQTYNELTMAYQTLYDQASQLINANTQLSNQINVSNKFKAEFEELNEELKMKCDHLENENSKLVRENVELSLKLSQNKDELNENRVVLEQVANLKREALIIDELKNTNDRLKQELNENNELIEQLNVAKDFLETTNSELYTKNVRLQMYLEGAGVNVQLVEQSPVASEFDELKRQLENYKNLYESLQQEDLIVRDTCKSLEEKNKSLRNQMEMLQSEPKQEMNENIEVLIKQELSSLQIELNKYIQNENLKRAKLQIDLNERTNELARVKLDIGKMESFYEEIIDLQMKLNNRISGETLLEEHNNYLMDLINQYQFQLNSNNYEIEGLKYNFSMSMHHQQQWQKAGDQFINHVENTDSQQVAHQNAYNELLSKYSELEQRSNGEIESLRQELTKRADELDEKSSELRLVNEEIKHLLEKNQDFEALKYENEELKQQVEDLSDKIQEQTRQIETFEKEVDNLRVINLEESVQDNSPLKQENEKLKESLSELKKKYDSLKVKANAFKEKLKESSVKQSEDHIQSETLASLQTKITDLEARNEELINQFTNQDEFLTKFNDLQVKYNDLEAEKDDLISNFNTVYSENIRLHERNDAFSQENDDIKKQYERDCSCLRENLAEIQIKYDELLNERDSLKAIYEEKINLLMITCQTQDNAKITELEERLSKEVDEKKALKETYDQLHQKALKLKAIAKNAKNSNKQHQAEQDLVSQSLLSSSTSSFDGEHQFNETSRRLDELRRENLQLKTSYETLNYDLNDIKANYELIIQRLNDEASKLRDSLVESNEIINLRNLQIDDLKVELKANQVTIEEQENNIQVLRQEKNDISKKFDKLKSKIKNVKDTKGKIEDKVEHLTLLKSEAKSDSMESVRTSSHFEEINHLKIRINDKNLEISKLSQDLNELNAIKSTLIDQISQFDNENQFLRQEIKEFDIKMDEKLNEIHKYKDELNMYRHENDYLVCNRDDLEQNLSSYLEKINFFESQLNESHEIINQLNQKIVTLTAQVDDNKVDWLNKEIQCLKDTIEVLNAKIDTQSNDLNTKNDILNQTKLENITLSNNQEHLEKQISINGDRVDDLNKDNQTLRESIELLNMQNTLFKTDIEDKQRQIDTITHDYNNLSVQVESLKVLKGSYENQLSEQSSDRDKFLDSINQLNEENRVLRAIIEDLKIEISSLHTQVSDSLTNSDNNDKQAQVDSLKREICTLKDHIEALNQELPSNKNESWCDFDIDDKTKEENQRSLVQERDDLARKVDNLNIELKIKENKIENLKVELDELEKLYSGIEAERDVLREQLQNLPGVNTFSEKNEQLRSEIEEKNKQIEQLNEKDKENQVKINFLSSELHTKSQVITQIQQELEEKASFENLKFNIETKNAKIQSLESTLCELQAKLREQQETHTFTYTNQQEYETNKGTLKNSNRNETHINNNEYIYLLEEKIHKCRIVCDNIANKLSQLKNKNEHLNEKFKKRTMFSAGGDGGGGNVRDSTFNHEFT